MKALIDPSDPLIDLASIGKMEKFWQLIGMTWRLSIRYISLLIFLLFPTFVYGTNEPINKNPLLAEADPISLPAGANGNLIIKLDLAEGHHAYLDMFRLKFSKTTDVKMGKFAITPVVQFFDKFSKKERKGIKGEAVLNTIIEIPESYSPKSYQSELALTYQACTEKYCLLPITIKVPLELNVTPQFGDSLTNTKDTILDSGEGTTTGSEFSKAKNKGFVYLFLFVFFAGLLTSFTPCIFPMIPITLAVLGASQKNQSRLRGFVISLSYVFGIALTYAILGLIAASTGSLFGGFLGNTWVAIALASVFVILALSMFGLFELKLPAKLENKLLGKKTESNVKGAFVSGLIAGVVASPCVGPVLISVLTYVSQTKDLFLGFFLLFTFAIGFGVLFLVLGTFSHLINKIPKAGPWMVRIKVVFGITMLGLALYYLDPVIKLSDKIGAKEAAHKLSNLDWKNYSEQNIQQAAFDGKGVVVDFYADWCAACKEMEILTFPKSEVQELKHQFVWIRFDATDTNEEFEKLQDKYGILGLPHFVIYDTSGKYRKDLTLTGFEDEKEFSERLKKAIIEK